MRFRKLLLPLCSLLFSCAAIAQQDTTYQRHSFKLPVASNQKGYEAQFTQQPSEIHTFEFTVPDSCMVFFVVRSENNGLDIRLGERVIKLRTKQDEQYVYSFAGELPAGTAKCLVRTGNPCSFTVYVKGQF